MKYDKTLASARKNPTAAIRSWHRKGPVLIVHDLDVDDAKREGRTLRAPGYVLRVNDAAGTFSLRGAVYKKSSGKTGRWRLEKESGSTATGTCELASGKHKLNASARALPTHRLHDLSMLMEWLAHETREHGRLPPPRPNPCGCDG